MTSSLKKVAINGFGRIGRLVLRIHNLLRSSQFEVVAINDLVPVENLAYLLKYDTVHGKSHSEIKCEGDYLIVDGRRILVTSEKDPAHLPWKNLKVDYVVESTGRFHTKEEAAAHLKAGAHRVVITAPAHEHVPTFVMGVNHSHYSPQTDFIISNASCTTNCLAVLAKVLLDHFGIEEGVMTTVHSLTASQTTVDGPSKKDWRGGRCASYNIIPSTTGAARAVSLCLPELKGKLTGMAFRVPTADVSVVDLSVRLKQETSYEKICDVIKKEASSSLKGILDFSDEEVVSSDFIGNSHSCIFDKGAGIALNNRFYKLVAWYDNEWGYSHRVVDLINYMATKD